jgi:HD-GYP domain-containing protein (c-di-GMP phosphodiesterase class II)
MKKLSVKILLVLSLVLATSMFFTIFYVNRSERKALVEEAFSAAVCNNMLAFDTIVALMSLKTPDFNVDVNSTQNFILDIMKKHEGWLRELRLIHRPDLARIFKDKEAGPKYLIKETEHLRDEKDREALTGTETRDSPVFEAGGKKLRTVRHIMPVKLEKRCLLCHQEKVGETVAAISSIVSVEEAFQNLKRRTIWNSVFLGSAFILTISALFLFLHNMVSRPLQKMSSVTRNIAEKGDLSQILEEKSSDEIGELAAAFNRMTGSLRNNRLEIIQRLSRAAEYRDEETGQHIQRTGLYAAALARKMGFDKGTVESLLAAAPMHDLGKIGIPDRILLKPGKLDSVELEIMKQHPLIGAQILKDSEVAYIKMAERIALTHHEKWDGSGYPKGLKGEEIPIDGQIVAIADTFDALTSVRPYRKTPFSAQEAFAIMRGERGKQFNPELLDIFLSLENEILKIKETHRDGEASYNFRIASATGEMAAPLWP